MLKLDNEFTLDEAQSRLPELVGRATRGEDIRIVNDDGLLVRLDGIAEERIYTQAERDEAFRLMREIADRNTLGGLRFKDLIEEGRR